ncbi:MAG TPA: aldolase/citrate lyase family protein [Burkholderiales bacterium]|nr:aldolase/citrate lyase family protein [Burkholderiales bacterium]
MRINKALELLEQRQPVYFEFVDAEDAGEYDGGRALAQTWADYIAYDMEHSALDVRGLMRFMRGLVDGGPTRSGHRTPAVIVTLPIDGTDEQSVRANGWMIKQVLATGVHGLLLCHAESPEAVRAFVEAARYAFHSSGGHAGAGHAGAGPELGPGRRGHGGQTRAAEIWGVAPGEYLARADPWPLDARGELLLGLKVENKRALAAVERTTRVPGIAFAEWGPGDMGMSMGYPDQHDEPYPAEMRAARARVMSACKVAGLAFLEAVTPENVIGRLEEGVTIGCGPRAQEAADIGRRYTRRALPW